VWKAAALVPRFRFWSIVSREPSRVMPTPASMDWLYETVKLPMAAASPASLG